MDDFYMQLVKNRDSDKYENNFFKEGDYNYTVPQIVDSKE